MKSQRRAIIGEVPSAKPKEAAKAFNMRAVAWRHRGYYVTRKAGVGWHAKHQLWRLFPRLPIDFNWRDEEDTAGLRAYLDAWYREDVTLRRMYEDQETAYGITFPDPSQVGETTTRRVSARRLFDCLKLTDEFDVPLWTRVAFVTDGHHLVPAEWIQLLSETDPRGLAHLRESPGPWKRATEADLVLMDLTPQEVSSGMYRRGLPRQKGQAPPAVQEARVRISADTQAAGVPHTYLTASREAEVPAIEEPVEASEPTVPPRERVVRRYDEDDYVDLLTESIPETGHSWFTRRLFRGRQVFYVATAWNTHGPWKVWQRDNGMLLALGIEL